MIEKLAKNVGTGKFALQKALMKYPKIASKRCVDSSAADVAKLVKSAMRSLPVDEYVKSMNAPVAVKANAKAMAEGIKRYAQFFNGKVLTELANWGREIKGQPAIFTKRGKLTVAGKKAVVESLAQKGLSADATLGKSISKSILA